MTAPTPPSGAAARRPPRGDLGAVAEWRHTATMPYLAVVLSEARPEVTDQRGRVVREAQPASAGVHTGPAGGYVDGVTDPRELRQMAWLLLGAARWLDAQQGHEHQPEPDPQPTLFEGLGAAC